MTETAEHQGTTDEQLARRAQEGCARSFETLVMRFQVPLLHFLRTRCPAPADAEDLLQETFLRAYRRLQLYDPRRRFGTWLYTMAYRLSINHVRKARPSVDTARMAHLASPDRSPVDQLIMAETQDKLWQSARELLTDRQFTVLWLHCVEQMAPAEIARVVRASGVSVRAALYRARKKLLPHLEAAQCGDEMTPTRRGVIGAKLCNT